jgi:hypothetical protein
MGGYQPICRIFIIKSEIFASALPDNSKSGGVSAENNGRVAANADGITSQVAAEL